MEEGRGKRESEELWGGKAKREEGIVEERRGAKVNAHKWVAQQSLVHVTAN